MKITNSKGEIHNTCPYLDEIKDFLTENNANSDLIESIEIIREIAKTLRDKSEENKISEYNEIERYYCQWRETPLDACKRMDKEIDDLKKELKEYL
jgi:hypothetical protein